MTPLISIAVIYLLMSLLFLAIYAIPRETKKSTVMTLVWYLSIPLVVILFADTLMHGKNIEAILLLSISVVSLALSWNYSIQKEASFIAYKIELPGLNASKAVRLLKEKNIDSFYYLGHSWMKPAFISPKSNGKNPILFIKPIAFLLKLVSRTPFSKMPSFPSEKKGYPLVTIKKDGVEFGTIVDSFALKTPAMSSILFAIRKANEENYEVSAYIEHLEGRATKEDILKEIDTAIVKTLTSGVIERADSANEIRNQWKK